MLVETLTTWHVRCGFWITILYNWCIFGVGNSFLEVFLVSRHGCNRRSKEGIPALLHWWVVHGACLTSETRLTELGVETSFRGRFCPSNCGILHPGCWKTCPVIIKGISDSGIGSVMWGWEQHPTSPTGIHCPFPAPLWRNISRSCLWVNSSLGL